MKETYIIGEIGQNHNGSVDLAKLIVELVARPIKEDMFGIYLKPMNAVKMTKRDLNEELADSQMKMPYDSPNSFGKTYGEHRAFLELSDQQHFEVYQYAKSLGLDFIETLCAKKCLDMLKLFVPDKLKVASRDLTNLPLLAALAETKIPIILSTGMAGKKELDEALEVITKYHSDISILHCVSQYPTRPENVNLRTITYLKKNYGQYKIGFSDHTIGIRYMEMSLGVEDIYIDKSVKASKIKLERSIATNRLINTGETITIDDIHMLSPGDGFKWDEKEQVVGKVAKKDIKANEIIYKDDIE